MSLAHIGENHGTCEETGSSTEESLGIKETVCIKKCGSELERPYPSPKGKEKAYKLGEIVFLMGESRRGT